MKKPQEIKSGIRWKRVLRKKDSGLKEELVNVAGEMAHIGGWEFDAVTLKGIWTDETARIHDLDPGMEPNVELGLNFYPGESRIKIGKAVEEAMKLGWPYDMELEFVSAKGVKKIVRTIGKPVLKDGKVVKVRGFLQDITSYKKIAKALNESRDKLERISHTIPGMLYDYELSVDGKFRFLYVSPQCSDLLGIEPAAMLSDADIFMNMIHKEDRQKLMTEEKSAGSTNREFKVEIRVITPSGKLKWIYINSRANPAAEGEPAVWSGLMTDVTDIKRMEEDREKLLVQLSQAHKLESVGRLAGGIAHDFNNMLMAILGRVEIAMTNVDQDFAVYADLVEIRNAAQRSADLARQLLAFSSKQIANSMVLDLNDVVSAVLKMMRYIIGADITLTWIPSKDPCMVNIDPAQINQMLGNLMLNARDAINGAGNVEILTKNMEFDQAYCDAHPGFLPGKYIMLGVGDNGAGMDKDALEHLFEPFFTTRKGKSTGLGLSIVYGIVKQNGGFINVESEPGKGTTFEIYLPCA